jgi:hypothetical protein
MRRRGHRIACLLAAATLALPAAASGQSAGDEQYEDPFAPEQGQTDDEGSSGGDDAGSAGGDDTGSVGGDDTGSAGGGSSGGGESVQPEPTAAPAAPTTTTAAEAQLARTGADTGLVALGGAVLLAGGVALRVTLRRR